MSFVVYFFVLLISAGSVLFGLDWLSAPMSPMPASRYELHAAREPSPPQSVREATPQPPAQPAPVAVVAPDVPAPRTAVSQTVAIAPAQEKADTAPATVGTAPAEAAPACDIDACTAAYRSFSAADCTYQPIDGPRRLCTKGTPPGTAAQTAPALPGPDARAQAACNIAACSQAYVSFSATDCTYQPLDGPRRLCAK